jgi:hypothetical protein
VRQPKSELQKLREHALIDADLTLTELAQLIGESWQAVSAVFRGTFRSVDRIEPKIQAVLRERVGKREFEARYGDLFPVPDTAQAALAASAPAARRRAS